MSDAVRQILEHEGIEIQLNAKCVAVENRGADPLQPDDAADENNYLSEHHEERHGYMRDEH